MKAPCPVSFCAEKVPPRKIGTGVYGNLPVMEEVKRDARRRKVELLIVPTAQAIETLKKRPEETNAVLHVTC